MQNNDNITTLSLLRLLSEGKLDASNGHFYENECFVLINPPQHQIGKGWDMFRHPVRLDCSAIMLCAEGKVTLTCNLQEVTIKPNTIFHARPGSIVQVTDIQQCRTALVLSGEKFIQQINLSIQNLLPHIGALTPTYTLNLTPDSFDYLWRQVEMVARSISLPTSLAYYHEIVRCNMRSLGYAFISQLIQHLQEQNEGHGHTVHNHEENLFCRFMQLVGQHYREERRITFYAEQMHLTPKYLSTVIRRASGHGPAEWITHNVLLEAKNLLRYSNMSIQEITYALHFPNQSFFGRWFKAQTGLSPKAYRDSK